MRSCTVRACFTDTALLFHSVRLFYFALLLSCCAVRSRALFDLLRLMLSYAASVAPGVLWFADAGLALAAISLCLAALALNLPLVCALLYYALWVVVLHCYFAERSVMVGLAVPSCAVACINLTAVSCQSSRWICAS
jgi:hypothetical protein